MMTPFGCSGSEKVMEMDSLLTASTTGACRSSGTIGKTTSGRVGK